MLKMMRQHAKYFYVLFFIVILSFIFWGVGTVDKGDKGSAAVAEIGKQKISADEYWQAYDRAFRFYRDLYKEKFDEEAQKKLKLKENVLNTLIENRVLLGFAQKNSITVSDEELNEAIKNEPAFMSSGSFDSDVYQNRLKLMRLSPEIYESAKRQELVLRKARRLIELSAIIPEDELSKITGVDQTMKTLRDALVNNAKDRAVKAYVEGLKKGLKIKINQDAIA